ncbi:MAG TPA: hypothetical protein VK468_04050, partial [Pyrinomonadaceae bacterium]|nr:hypothetical protein [Pyrinomonadaceae bacterium]
MAYIPPRTFFIELSAVEPLIPLENINISSAKTANCHVILFDAFGGPPDHPTWLDKLMNRFVNRIKTAFSGAAVTALAAFSVIGQAPA